MLLQGPQEPKLAVKKGLAYLWRDPPKAVQNFWDTKVTEPRALYDEVESLHMHEVSSSSFPTATFSVRLTSKN